MQKHVQAWEQEIQPVLKSKLHEFKLLGYPNISQKDIWNCLVEKVWKGNPKKRLHEIVSDIFHLSLNTYMNYETINAYQTDDLMASIRALTNEDKDNN